MSPPQSELQATLTGMAALAIAMGVGRFAFTPMLPIMQAEGLLSMIEAGLLGPIHFFGYWLGSISAGWKPVWSKSGLRFSLLLIVLSTCAMGLTRWYPLWFLLRLATGRLYLDTDSHQRPADGDGGVACSSTPFECLR